MRKLGDILTADFGWPEEVLQEALAVQRQQPEPRAPLGQVLLERSPTHVRTARARDVAAALALQATPVAMRPGASFDREEYHELQAQLELEVNVIDRHVRFYVIVVTGLFVFGGFPMVLDGADLAAAFRGFGVPYAVLGSGLTALVVFVGNNLVYRYTQYRKTCHRVRGSRAILRGHMVARGATPTLMPSRGPEPHERPDPDVRPAHRRVVQYYALLSFGIMLVAVYFVSVGCYALMGSPAPKDTNFEETFWRAARFGTYVILCLLGAWWARSLARLQWHYLVGLREIAAIRPEDPYPQFDHPDRHAQGQGIRNWRAGGGAQVALFGAVVLLCLLEPVALWKLPALAEGLRFWPTFAACVLFAFTLIFVLRSKAMCAALCATRSEAPLVTPRGSTGAPALGGAEQGGSTGQALPVKP